MEESDNKSINDKSAQNNSQLDHQKHFRYCGPSSLQGQVKDELRDKQVNNSNTPSQSNATTLTSIDFVDWRVTLGHELALIAAQFHTQLLKSSK